MLGLSVIAFVIMVAVGSHGVSHRNDTTQVKHPAPAAQVQAK